MLAKGGYIESFTVKTPSKHSPTSTSKIRHLRLLKPFILDEKEDEGKEEEERENERGGEGESVRREPLLFEVPIEIQGYRIIDNAGPQGINNAVCKLS